MVRAHILKLLTLLALLLAPAGMMGEHSATAAAPIAAAAGHCAETNRSGVAGHEREAPARDIDCMIACACISATAAPLPEPLSQVAAVPPAIPGLLTAGLNHAAEPPPPRSA